MTERKDLIFREEQKFSLRIALPVVVLMVLVIGVSVRAVAIINQGTFSILWIILLFVPFGILLPLAVSTLILVITLETEVRPDGLYVRYFPIHIEYKKFAPEQLERYYARQYKPILERGRWRFRFFRRVKSYRLSGNKSVQFLLKSGKQLLIGSQKPYELVEAIDSIMKKT